MRRVSVWTIYDFTIRRGWVATRWDIDNGKMRLGWETITAKDLDSLRAILSGYGHIPLGANITDDPQVVECWI